MARLAERVVARELQMKPEHLRSAAALALEGGEAKTNKNYWWRHPVARGTTPMDFGVVYLFCSCCDCGFARRFETIESGVQQAKDNGDVYTAVCSTRCGGCGVQSVIRPEALGIPIMETNSREHTKSEWEAVFRTSV